jgi:WS/DGAT/MGAT family acyltransferase
MDLMSPIDAIFLVGESREHPMHVGGLQLYRRPPGAGRGFVREFYNELVAQRDFQPTFRKRPAALAGGLANLAWTIDRDIDIDYHVRRSALASPGRVRELLELTSRLHSSLLDRHRPLWETHIIEGLRDGRFAVYTKVHHALLDGVSAQKLVQRALSNDPDDPEIRALWALPKPKRRSTPSPRSGSVWQTVGSLAALAPSTVALARAALFEQQLTLPFGAPRTMFNVKIGGARRCAAQSWPLERIKNIKEAAGVTVNDVVLAMCSGALRYYLLEHGALPDTPLHAMVPVSLRTEEEADAGGNLVGAILCNLATDVEDPAARLRTISDSISSNKQVFSQLPRPQALALSAMNMAGLTFAAVPGLVASTPPPFNIVISNVPGPRQPMYYGGARLDGNYPFSIALDGQALNITLANNGDNLDFGLVGCRRSVPHLQRLLAHLESSLKDLERAIAA